MCTYMATQIPIRMSYSLCNYVFRCENVKLYTNAAYMARFVNLHIIGVVYGMFFQGECPQNFEANVPALNYILFWYV